MLKACSLTERFDRTLCHVGVVAVEAGDCMRCHVGVVAVEAGDCISFLF